MLKETENTVRISKDGRGVIVVRFREKGQHFKEYTCLVRKPSSLRRIFCHSGVSLLLCAIISSVSGHPTMLLPRLGTPSRALISTFQRPAVSVDGSHGLLEYICPAAKSPLLSFIRHATHKAQGSVNGGKDGAGKRLGAKKSGG